ncbi:MAG: MazG nucleotide pyrophosphohydrolase domain-containing protein [Desulfurococcaceae archaeon]
MDIKNAQSLIKAKYYEKDSTRGLYSTFTWFVEEVGELADALIKLERDVLEEELADVFAWLLSIANLVEIDLEQAFMKKYGSDERPSS